MRLFKVEIDFLGSLVEANITNKAIVYQSFAEKLSFVARATILLSNGSLISLFF